MAVAAGFPVHISCMAINGAVIATAAGEGICFPRFFTGMITFWGAV